MGNHSSFLSVIIVLTIYLFWLAAEGINKNKMMTLLCPRKLQDNERYSLLLPPPPVSCPLFNDTHMKERWTCYDEVVIQKVKHGGDFRKTNRWVTEAGLARRKSNKPVYTLTPASMTYAHLLWSDRIVWPLLVRDGAFMLNACAKSVEIRRSISADRSQFHAVSAKVPGDHVQPETHRAQGFRVQPVPVCATIREIWRFQLRATAEKEPAKLVPEVTCTIQIEIVIKKPR